MFSLTEYVEQTPAYLWDDRLDSRGVCYLVYLFLFTNEAKGWQTCAFSGLQWQAWNML